MKNKTNLFRRIRNIIVGNTLPKNEDLWLDTSEGEKQAMLKYKGNAINKYNGIGNSVHVIISDDNTIATFMWPFEDTNVEDIIFEGYNGMTFTDTYKFPLSGLKIRKDNLTAEYTSYGWGGDLAKLVKGEWYVLQYSGATNMNCSIYMKSKV